MKKAKIMFAAITVLAVVGGALAFKAKTVNSLKLYGLTTDNQNVSYCTVLLEGVTVTDQPPSFSTSEGTIVDGAITLVALHCLTTITFTMAE